MVLVIMTVTAAVFITMMMIPTAANRQVKETRTKGLALRAAIKIYQAQRAVNPATLDVLVTPEAGQPCNMQNADINSKLQGWCGPYLDRVFVENANDYKTDGWAQTFQYDSVGDVITSCGPDRVCGTGDEISF